MTKQEISRRKPRKNFIKGGFAEKIVAALFETLGYHVFPNGIENRQPELIVLRKRKLVDRADIVKYSKRADFVVIRERTDTVTPLRLELEVKYAKSSTIKTADLLPYETETTFLLTDAENFWFAEHQEIAQLHRSSIKTISFSSLRKLESVPLFSFNKKQVAIILSHKPYLRSILTLDDVDSATFVSSSPDKSTKSKQAQEKADNTKDKKTVEPTTRQTAKKSAIEKRSDHGKPWTPDKLNVLAEEYSNLLKIKSSHQAIALLAKEFGRSNYAIWCQLKEMKLTLVDDDLS